MFRLHWSPRQSAAFPDLSDERCGTAPSLLAGRREAKHLSGRLQLASETAIHRGSPAPPAEKPTYRPWAAVALDRLPADQRQPDESLEQGEFHRALTHQNRGLGDTGRRPERSAQRLVSLAHQKNGH